MAESCERLLSLIQRLWEATLDETAWGDLLRAVCTLTDSAEASLFVFDALSGRCVSCISLNTDTGWVGRCDRIAANRCVWTQYGTAEPDSPAAGPRAPAALAHACPALAGYPVAGRPLSPNVIVLELWRRDGECASLALRRASAGPLDPVTARVLEDLLPYLRRAFLASHLLDVSQRHGALLAQALGHSTNAVVLLDGDGRVVYTNAAARAILAQGDGLYVEGDRLRAVRKASSDALQRLLDGAAMAVGLKGATIAVPRRSGRSAYLLVVVPAGHAASALGADRATWAVLIADPAATPQVSEEQLRELYGLTEREAQIALLLASGETVGDAATTLGIAEKTARVHLQGLFRKSGTRRQVDLIRLLLASPALGGGQDPVPAGDEAADAPLP